MKCRILFAGLFTFYLILNTASLTFAIEPEISFSEEASPAGKLLKSDKYRLEIRQVFESQERFKDIKKTSILTQLEQKNLVQNGFVIKKKYSQSFSLKVNPSNVTFNHTDPGSFIDTETHLTVTQTDEDPLPYTLSAALITPFQTESGEIISPTHCDNSHDACSSTRARAWSKPQSYGWGFQVKGNNQLSLFDVKNTYATIESEYHNIFIPSALKPHETIDLLFRLNREPYVSEGVHTAIIDVMLTPELY